MCAANSTQTLIDVGLKDPNITIQVDLLRSSQNTTPSFSTGIPAIVPQQLNLRRISNDGREQAEQFAKHYGMMEFNPIFPYSPIIPWHTKYSTSNY